MESDPIVTALRATRQQFLDLVADIRPELHRYCARMTGSAAEGEDIVQDTLARAYYHLSEAVSVPALRPWLFKIAHHRAIDHLRSYERKNAEPLGDAHLEILDMSDSVEDRIAAREATRVALSRFSELPPTPRSVVILKDVLGHSLEEIAELLGLSLAAVKSTLHRGRKRLRELSEEDAENSERGGSELVARYIALFNARDWDALRALLAEDVRLDLVTRAKRNGAKEVSEYFTNYARGFDWRLAHARIDGREGIAVFEGAETEAARYFVHLEVEGGRIVFIKDYRYVPYVAREALIELL